MAFGWTFHHPSALLTWHLMLYSHGIRCSTHMAFGWTFHHPSALFLSSCSHGTYIDGLFIILSTATPSWPSINFSAFLVIISLQRLNRPLFHFNASTGHHFCDAQWPSFHCNANMGIVNHNCTSFYIETSWFILYCVLRRYLVIGI